MNSDSLEAQVYAHVRKHDGFYLFGKPELTEQTDLDFDLQLDEDEALALMEDFFTTFSVARGNFSITTKIGIISMGLNCTSAVDDAKSKV